MNIFSDHKESSVNTLSDVLMTLLYVTFVTLSTDSTGVYMMVGIILTIYILNIIHDHKKLKLHIGIFHGYMLVWALFCYISSFWAINPGDAYEKGTTIISLLISFSLLYAIYYKSEIDRLLRIVMWAGFVLSIYSIIFYGISGLQSTLEAGGRLENDFANVNEIGMTCSIAIIIAAYLNKKRKSLVELFLCIPSILIVAGSGSRKALVMLILGLIFIFVYQGDKKTKGINKYVNVICSIIVVSLILMVIMQTNIFSGTMDRMDGFIASLTGEGEVDSSTKLRELYRMLGFKQLTETPILGMGMGNAHFLAIWASGHDCYLHCNYAELAANGGIVGLILYYWIYVVLLRKEYNFIRINRFAPVILLLIIMRLVMDWGAVSYYSKSTYFMLMIFTLHYERLKCEAKNMRLKIQK
ncbi:MAG: O-antigen ligase family protein [Clostridiales bacterium]|nr:O-antigen ligase family protein [Clostridiales bacterium]